MRSAVAACAAALAAFAGATGPAHAQPYLYATDATAKVVVFDAGREAATPIWTLTGDDVFGEPYGIAADGRGRLYVADAVTNALVLFGTGARNRSTPALVLRGVAVQGIDVPAGLAAAADGELFVANLGGGTVSVFPRSLGDGLPSARIDTRRLDLHGPGAVAIDAASGRLAVAGFADDAVAFFQRDAAGAWQPAGRLAGPATLLRSPAGLAFDAGGDLFVTNANADSVTAYAPGATGDSAPLRELRGPATRLHNPTGIALAPTGIAYVASFSTAEIEAFGAEANGNAAPFRTFSDGLRGPLGLALEPLRRRSRRPGTWASRRRSRPSRSSRVRSSVRTGASRRSTAPSPAPASMCRPERQRCARRSRRAVRPNTPVSCSAGRCGTATCSTSTARGRA